MRPKISKHYSSSIFEANLMINKAVMGEYKVMDILAICFVAL